MITKQKVQDIAQEAGLTVSDVILHPYGRKWQAIAWFAENYDYGVSLLYEFPYLTNHPGEGREYSFAICERYVKAAHGFVLADEDMATYDISRDELIQYLKALDWSQYPPEEKDE
jgi:hypothetical protein